MSDDAVGPAGEPLDRLEAGGWTLDEERTETLFSLPTARVEGLTRLYEDPTLRQAVLDAGGPDHLWRFFFATSVTFDPPLSRGVVPLIKPTVITESSRRFADDLRDRGFEDVRRGTRQTVRVRSGSRARLTDFSARYTLTPDERERRISVRGFLAVWSNGTFRLAGGAYPESGLGDLLEGGSVTPDGDAYRDELLELIRSVE